MRIAIDCRVLNRTITGTGRYLLNILQELPTLDKMNEYFLFTGKDLDVDKNFYNLVYIRKSFIPLKIYSPAWLNLILPIKIKWHKIDLLFAPNILLPLVSLKETKYISVIHDILPKKYKEYYPYFYRKYLSLYLPISIKRSDKIITVSQQSKKDIIKFYNVPPNKIEIIYNTASKLFVPQNLSDKKHHENKLSLPNKFLLYVGVVEKRKNILGIIKIIDMVRENGSKLELVIIGKPGFAYERIIPEIQKRKHYIKYFPFLEDMDLAYTYNMAFAFIFPSYYEGFGIPPLEAMQTGLPVLSSNTSALTEVVGNGGIMHPPDDYTNFANDILKLENDKYYYDFMKHKALEQAKNFNARESAQKIVDLFGEFR